MPKMTFKPPTIEEVEAYVRKRNLTVDPSFFFDYFETGEWVNSRNHPVRNWKQKILTWHRMNLERGGSHKCSAQYCKKPGIYIAGKDRDGHPYYYCIDHKPKPKPLPKELVPVLKVVPQIIRVNVNNERNRQIEDLAKKRR